MGILIGLIGVALVIAGIAMMFAHFATAHFFRGAARPLFGSDYSKRTYTPSVVRFTGALVIFVGVVFVAFGIAVQAGAIG